MKALDYLLQSWRISKARRFIPPQARVLDIGSSDGALYQRIAEDCVEYIGIDPTLPAAQRAGKMSLIKGFFPQDVPATGKFDAIVMLATLEHFPAGQYDALKRGCSDLLRPGGRLIITVPAPAVDHILAVLKGLRLIDGMSLEEHHGYRVEHTTTIFDPGHFRLEKRTFFQLGLNNLFVFQRTGD